MQEYWELCKSAVNGHYEHCYFDATSSEEFSPDSKTSIARLRAVVQHLNTEFYTTVRLYGHKFQILTGDDAPASNGILHSVAEGPTRVSREESIKWVQQVLVRTRGKELVGNFNPLLIGELFWEQSSGWKKLAINHIEKVSRVCENFLESLLEEKASKDVKARLWPTRIAEALKSRRRAAFDELDKIMEDLRSFPINYNHYYTDTIHKRRLERQKSTLAKAVESGIEQKEHTRYSITFDSVNIEKVIQSFNKQADPNMESFSCEEALDCLFAIYKVSFHLSYLFKTLVQRSHSQFPGPAKDFRGQRHNSSYRTPHCSWSGDNLLAGHREFHEGLRG